MNALRNKKSSSGKWKEGKFPFYHQHDGMDCGPACLRMIAESYGRKHSLQRLRDLSNISRSGVNLYINSNAAQDTFYWLKACKSH